MLADLRFEHNEGVVVATLSGDIDMSNADEIKGGLIRAVTNEVLSLVLDLSSVDYFDSAGIHLLYDLRERLRIRGQELRIVVPAVSNVRDTLELAAVLHSVEADDTVEAAMARLAGGGGQPDVRPSPA